MSEFKYACPVCGQHIRCDSSQGGSTMQCPTCLQKIIAPQAPSSADQKLIISGKRLGEQPKTQVGKSSPAELQPPSAPGFPMAVALVVLVVLVLAAGAAVLVLRLHVARTGEGNSPANPQTPGSVEAVNKPAKPPAPPVVIPHANDTNWTLSLEGVASPDTPAAGRLHGQDFLAERTYLQNGTLTLRMGNKGTPDFALLINFSGAQPEALAGKTINITSNAPVAAHVTLRWKETDQDLKDNFETGYALRIEFGELAKNHLPAKIYFCAPDDEKSYVAGKVNIEVRKPKAAKPKPATGATSTN